MSEQIKPNCYECTHRGSVAGSAHSSCHHPVVADPTQQMLELVGLLTGQKLSLGVTGNTHGMLNGWFSWPLDFDPVWLLTCNGFEKAV